MDDADAELQAKIDYRSGKIILKAAKRMRGNNYSSQRSLSDQDREVYLED